MHMKSAPHLPSEDRADFERILDDALRNAHDRPDLESVGQRLNTEQLRTMALNAMALITAAAATEYEHYAKMRQEFRSPPAAVRDSILAPAVRETAEAGAGLAAVVTVLVPVLAGTAAAIFLLVGYLLKALDPPPAFSSTMVGVGWFFATVTAIGILAAAAGLLMTALRNGATELSEKRAAGELPAEVLQARAAWHHALLEHGILPFLRAALADPGAAPTAPVTPPRTVNHLPKIGYSRPNFSSPGEGSTAGQRPTYSSPDFSSPDFSSPDFGGPDHQPD
jgi:type II secretory pathway pseudopilin PulG